MQSEYLSVIIATHNGRKDYRDRVLEALRAQTLPLDSWELVIIDNASDRPIANETDLSWHPRARCIEESILGLSVARLRGIREGAGSILVFVDDDNLLQADYLEQTRKIALDFPMLGAWGSGDIVPEFEVSPPEWTRPYWRYIALRTIERDLWGNFALHEKPWGAGMTLRRVVAEQFAANIQNDPLRRSLDRRGSSLISSGDVDLALTAIDMGFGIGIFCRLRLIHLIHAGRLREPYLLSLLESMHYSDDLLERLRILEGGGRIRSRGPLVSGIKDLVSALKDLPLDGRTRRFRRAIRRGEKRARAEMREMTTVRKNTGQKEHGPE